jgi:hypothetical protein
MIRLTLGRKIMKKWLFTFVLIVSNLVSAQVIELHRNGHYTIYYDEKSIQRKGSISLIEVTASGYEETIGGKVVKSARSVYEFDCKKNLFRYLKRISYSREKLEGAVVESKDFRMGSDKEADWKAINEIPLFANLHEIGCRK